MLSLPVACNDLRFLASSKATHRFVEAGHGDIQIRTGRLNVRMAEHILHFVKGDSILVDVTVPGVAARR